MKHLLQFFIPLIVFLTYNNTFAQNNVNKTINAANQAIRQAGQASGTLKDGIDLLNGLGGIIKKKKKPENAEKVPTGSERKNTTKQENYEVYTPEEGSRGVSTPEAMEWFLKSEDQPTDAQKIEYLNKAIKADPTLVDAYYNRGYYLAELGNHTKAIEDYDRVITFRSNDPEVLNNRGYSKLELKEYSEAIKDFGLSIANNHPQLHDVFNNRGRAYTGLMDYNNALKDFDNALLHKSNSYEVMYRKAEVLNYTKQNLQALKILDEIVVQNPKYSDAWYLRGNVNAELARYKESVEDYNKVLKITPDDNYAIFARAVSKGNDEKYKEAISDYNIVLKADVNYAEAYNNRGYCYMKDKQYDLAIKDFNASIQYNHPEKHLVYTNRGEANFKLGSVAEARKDYKQALAYNAGYNLAIEGEQKCNAILNPSSVSNNSGTVRPSNLLKRFALVIGNSKYLHTQTLANNPINDADDMAERLGDLGYTVIRLKDAYFDQMNSALEELIQKAQNADVVTLFFAGHGVEGKDKMNYLMPIDALLVKEEKAPRQAISLDFVLDQLKKCKSKINLIFLDACRNDPFEGGSEFGRGGDKVQEARAMAYSAPPKLLPDYMVFYATQPKEIAGNGNGRNGNLTRGILKHMNRGIELKDMWQKVTSEVYSEITKGVQLPYQAGTQTTDYVF